MLGTIQRQETTMADSLKECFTLVEQVRDGLWNFVLFKGSNLHGTVRTEGEWLLLEAPLRSGKKHSPTVSIGVWDFLRRQTAKAPPWQLLLNNAQLSGGVKFSLRPNDEVVNLRAEIPMGEGIDLGGRIHQAFTGFKAALEKVRVGKTVEQAIPQQVILADGPVQDRTSDLPRLCSEAGWPLPEGSGGRPVFDLGIPNEFFQAHVEDRMGEVHVWVDLASNESIPQPCQEAIGILLLKACGIVRMVRAAVGEKDGRIAVWFEVVFEGSPTSEELKRALSALYVACWLCGREVKLLEQDEEVAREYLAFQG